MKVTIEVDGLKAEASVDYEPSCCLTTVDKEAMRSAIFSRLATEARTVAKELIAAKYAKEGDAK